jgi:DNA-binding PadR family transcriptional regulator
MSVPMTLLGLLEREPSHGYELRRDYDALFGRDKPLPVGQLYSTLGRLVRDGKAVAGPAEPGEGPERKPYAITGAGQAEVEAWLGQPAEPGPYLQPVLFAKIMLALLLGRPVEPYLDAQRGVHLKRMGELTEQRRSGGLFDSVLADYGLFHLDADLRWIDMTSQRLTALAQAVSR